VASVGTSIVNSGSMGFLYNNLQASLLGTNSSNTNGVLGTPVIQGLDNQNLQQQSNRQRGGTSWHQPTNSTVVSPTNTNAVMLAIGGEFGLAAQQLGYTKGGAFLIVSNTNGTQAITFDLTNTQANTNSYWGDTTFANANVIIMSNLCNIEGISSNNGTWYVNGSATNGAVLGLNTNGSYAITANGGTVVIAFPQPIAIAAATCKVLCTPTNGGVLGVAVYGS
jgi:hypothetical protein